MTVAFDGVVCMSNDVMLAMPAIGGRAYT